MRLLKDQHRPQPHRVHSTRADIDSLLFRQLDHLITPRAVESKKGALTPQISNLLRIRL